MSTRSTLGDLVVEHDGPYSVDNPQGELLWRIGNYEAANALRDELIELRAKADAYDRLPPWVRRLYGDADSAPPAAWWADSTHVPTHDQGRGSSETQRGSQAADDRCEAETWSWRHFSHADNYWIACDVRGPHDQHEDEHTGLKWRGDA